MKDILTDSVNDLFQAAMSPVMRQAGKTHNGLFLTQKEFEQNIDKIFTITAAKRRIEEAILNTNFHS